MSNYKYKTTKPHQFILTGTYEPFVNEWLTIEMEMGLSIATVSKGYAFDGCSPKFNILDLFIFGTPDGVIDINTKLPKTYLASLIHDALYQFKIGTRKDADKVFEKYLILSKFSLTSIYYFSVRLFGWRFW